MHCKGAWALIFVLPPITIGSASLLLRPAQTQAADDAVLEQFAMPSDGDLISVPVSIRGNTYRFMLDTGSTRTVCDKSLQPELGKPIGRAKARTATGTFTSPVFQSSALKVGRLRPATSMPLVIADLSYMRSVADHDIRGILGMDFLSDHVVRLDFDRSELQFLARAGIDPAEPVPMQFNDRREPTVTVSIGSVGKLDFVIDTGYVGLASGGISSARFVELVRRGLIKERGGTVLATATEMTEDRCGILAELSLEHFMHSRLLFDELGSDNVLSIRFLSRYLVTLDFPGARLYLARGRRFNAPDLVDMSGLHLWRVEGVIRVHSVDRGSPGDKAGIRTGDELLRINGLEGQNTALHTVRKLLCESGNSVTFHLLRGGEADALSIVLCDWRAEKGE